MALRVEQFHIGERLKLARERRGIELTRASEETRIDRSYLEALEQDAGSESFPGPVFARAFLREYARYLGLNPRPLVDAYRATHPERDWPFLGGPEPIDRRRPWIRVAAFVVLIAVAVTATVVLARRETTLAPPVVPDVGSRPPVIARGGGDGPETESPAPARGVHLRIRLVEASWVAVSAGDRELISETQIPGYARTFHDRRGLSVVIGNADGANVWLNGKPLELEGIDDDVYRADMRYRDGRVRVLPED